MLFSESPFGYVEVANDRAFEEREHELEEFCSK